MKSEWLVIPVSAALLVVPLSIVGSLSAEATPRVNAAADSNTEWRQVATWKGDSIGNTQPFRVGTDWRIVWKAYPGTIGNANFAIDVRQPKASIPTDMIGNVIGSGSGTTYESGAGTYYLNIQSDENYIITIETKTNPVNQPHLNWSTVYKTAGDATGDTDSFKVKSPWRVIWSCEPGSQGAANFSVVIKEASAPSTPVSMFANVAGSEQGVDYEYTSGTFSLGVLTDENYSIEVQQGSR